MLVMWSRRIRAATAVVAVLFATGAAAGFAAWQFQHRATQKAAQLTGGDPEMGRKLMRQFGCAGCHTVSGVPGAVGLVGPQLTQVRQRVYIAGVLTNTPDNLVRWMVDPKAYSPRTAMPRTGISEEQARHVAAFLYSQ
ncbi:MAG: c-type cytochrome [Xanthobacteraceae bacterium]